MRSLAIPLAALAALAALALTPTEAAASSCYLGPFVQTTSPSLACEVVIYTQYDAPRLQVRRDNLWIDVTGETTQTETALTIDYYEYSCSGTVENQLPSTQASFLVYRVAPEGAYPGEELFVDHFPVGVLTTDPSCVEPPPPDPECAITSMCESPEDVPPDSHDDDLFDGGGCHTSGNSCGGAAALALLALVRRRGRPR